MQRQNLHAIWVVFCAATLLSLGCGSSRPPTGKKLRLKGAKGAQCTYDRECGSDKCLGRLCTEKIDKVGVGGECTGDQFCKDGFHCDVSAKKCAPDLECDKFSAKLRKCLRDVYVAFRPKQVAKLERMRAKAKRRFYTKIYRILYRGLCNITRSGASYKRSLSLLRALKQSDCGKFAAYYYKGTKKGS